MATLAEVQDALAAQIQAELSGTADPVIENLNVHARMRSNATPPAVDMYPATPFIEPHTFGRGRVLYNLMVRARVTTADSEGGQDMLLALLDPVASTSVLDAITADRTLGGVVQNVTVTEITGFQQYRDGGLAGGELHGCTWRVQVIH